MVEVGSAATSGFVPNCHGARATSLDQYQRIAGEHTTLGHVGHDGNISIGVDSRPVDDLAGETVLEDIHGHPGGNFVGAHRGNDLIEQVFYLEVVQHTMDRQRPRLRGVPGDAR